MGREPSFPSASFSSAHSAAAWSSTATRSRCARAMDPRMSRTHRGLRSVLSRTCGFLQDWNARGGMLAGRRGPTGSLHVESRWKFSWNARVYGTCFFLSAALGLGTSRVCWDHILFSAAAEGRAALGQCNCGDGSRGSADTRDVVSVLPLHLRYDHW